MSTVEVLPPEVAGSAGPVALGRNRPRSAPIVAVVAAAAVVAGVLIVGRNGGGTTAPPTTVAAAPTSTTARPSTAAGTYTERQTFMNFLGAARSGTVLYGLTVRGDLVRIEPDDGVISTRTLVTGSGADAVWSRSGGAVVAQGNRVEVVGDGPGGTIVTLTTKRPTIQIVPATDPAELWKVGDGAAQRVHLDGTPAGERVPLTAAFALGDDGTGGLLVVQDNAGVSRIAEHGDPQHVVGLLVAWSASTLVQDGCYTNTAATCLEVVDRATGMTRRVPGAPAVTAFTGSLAPNGSLLAAPSGPDDRTLLVIDLASGATRSLGSLTPNGSHGMAWSADGSWLFWVDAAGALHGWHAGDGASISIDGAGHVPPMKAVAAAPAAS